MFQRTTKILSVQLLFFSFFCAAEHRHSQNLKKKKKRTSTQKQKKEDYRIGIRQTPTLQNKHNLCVLADKQHSVATCWNAVGKLTLSTFLRRFCALVHESQTTILKKQYRKKIGRGAKLSSIYKNLFCLANLPPKANLSLSNLLFAPSFTPCGHGCATEQRPWKGSAPPRPCGTAHAQTADSPSAGRGGQMFPWP